MYRKLTYFLIIPSLLFCILFAGNSAGEVLPQSSAQQISDESGQPVNKNISLFQKTGGIFLLLSKRVQNNKVIYFISSHFSKILMLCFSVVIIVATILFYRLKLEKNRFMTTTRLSIMDKEVQRACRYIELNFASSELNVEKLCNELVTGAAFLEALFERELGMSIDDFTDQVRINHAKIILNKDPSVSIEEVVNQIGFLESRDFSRSFQAIVGTDFAKYKESILSSQISS